MRVTSTLSPCRTASAFFFESLGDGLYADLSGQDFALNNAHLFLKKRYDVLHGSGRNWVRTVMRMLIHDHRPLRHGNGGLRLLFRGESIARL
jgi:hypothetical protein